MAKRGAEVGDVKNEEGRADSEPMSQRSNVGDEQQVNDMRGVMLHSSNTGITQELEDVSDLSYGIGATTTQSCVRMEPKEISITQLLQHEVLFVMVFPEALPNHVKDAYASFGDMPAVQLKKKNDFNLIGAVPASLKPGKVKVRVTSSAGDQLGETWFQCLDEMLDMFERLKGDPDLQRSFFTLWNHTTPGNAQQVQLLRLLIYTAAREGAQQFIEMILSTSAGRLVFNAYKDSQPLPEVVARDHGHNETACYLEGVTRRFSVEISASKEYPKKINWSELAQAAAEEAQKCNAENKSCHLISDLSKDAGYLGDLETSSSEPNSSGSEDDISIASKRVNEDENLARAMNLEVIDVHDVQSLQDTEVAEKAEVMFPKIWEAVQCHPTGVDKLDDVKMEGKISDICTKDLDSTQEEICTNSDIDVDQRGVIEDISPSLGSVKKGKEHADWDRISPQTIKLTTPGASLSGWGDVIFKADHCYCLGSTKLFYYPDEREVVIMVKNPNLFETLCKDMSCHTANSSYNCSDEGTQRSESFAGRLVFDAYKNSQPLPEVVAKDHGHNKTACYLEGVTKRFSEETFAVEEYPKTIDWSELAKAAEEAQRKHECNTENESSDLTSDLSKDAGYLGDLETSSNEPQSSDSEDDIYITSNNVYGDENLARMMDSEVIDVHDVQSLQDTEEAEKFQEKEEVLFPKMQETIQFLPTMADKLDDVRMEGKISDISTKDLHLAREEISINSDNDMDQLGVIQDISPSSSSVKKSQEHVDWDRISSLTIKSTTSECAVSESGYDDDDEDSSSDSSDNGNQEPMRKRGDVGDDQQVA